MLKKMKEKSSRGRAGADTGCAEIGLVLEDFIGLSVRAMQEIAPALGL